jgi:hypothetical protein
MNYCCFLKFLNIFVNYTYQTKLLNMKNNYDSVVSCNSSGTPHSQKQESTSYTATKRNWLSFVTVLITLFCFMFAQGQSSANYTFTSGTSTLNSMTGSTPMPGITVFPADDDDSTVVPIGFNFIYMGSYYSHFSVNSNGQMRLHTSAGATAISTSSVTSYAASTVTLAPMAGDNETGTGMSYLVSGSAPNRKLIIEWNNFYANWTDPQTSGNMQLVLSEGTGVIDFLYGNILNSSTSSATKSIFHSSGSATNTSAYITVGATPIQNTTATSPIINSFAASVLIANLANKFFTFTPPAPASGPTGLTITGATTTAMNLAWTAAATTTGIARYVVFNSINGGTTYNFVANVALGTNLYNATGLAPGTTYTWKVVAISEGVESTPETATQATLNGATYYWTGATGDTFATLDKWNTAADGTGTAPSAFASTDVYVIDGDGTTPGGSTTINIGANVTVGQLKITSNTAVTFQSLTSTTRTITISGGPGDDFLLESGSTLNLTNALATPQAAAIAFSGTGTTGLIAGTLNFAGAAGNAFTTTGGTGTLVTVASTAVVNLGFAGNSLVGSVATLTFENGSNCNSTGATTGAPPVPLATWGATSNLTITGVTTSTTTATNNAQSFGNVTYNCPSALATMSFWAATTTAVVKGDLTINATNRGRFRATTSGTVTINGNLILNGGTFEVASTSGTVKVLGNVIQNGGRLDITSGTSTASLLVAGQFNQVAGDLLVSGTSSTNKIEFNGTAAQNVTFNGTTNGAAVFRVNNPSGINLTGTMNINAKGGLVISNGNITGSGSVVYIPTHNYTSAVGANNTYVSAAGATSSTTTITVASTDGLQQGMTVSVSAGVGAFTTTTTVSAITSATTFTVSTAPTTALSGGATVVSASGGSVINVQSTVGLQPGMAVAITAGNGVFAASTTISAINTATSFTVSAAPTTALSGGATVVTGTNTGVNTLTYNGAVAQTSNALEFPATNGPAALTVNNTATAPNNVVTVPFTRTLVGTAGTLTLTAGILDNSTYILTVPNTAVSAVSAGSATAYVKGALERGLLPGSISTTPSVYSFPVGKSGFNPFALVNPTTSATGEVSVKAEVFDAPTGGTNGTLIGALNINRYWAASITNGSANFTNALIKLSDAPNGADAIASSTTLTGAYSMVGGLTTTATATSLQSTTPEVTTLDGYYVMGSKAAATLATPTITPSGNQCTNVARAISVLITPGGGAITAVLLNYSINGVAQTAISMTNSTNVGGLAADTWIATIPTVTPTNANITWSIIATDANSLSRSVTGAAYKDEPNLGVSASASASLETVCAGLPSSLSVSFANAAPALYSSPVVSNPTSDEDLGNVTITQGVTPVLNNTSTINSLTGSIGVATGTAGSFGNYTSFGPYAMTAGTTYNFSLTSLTTGTSYGNSMAIFIDYNRDGDFADAGENVYAASATTSGPHTETGTFTIPVTAFSGTTRMRVVCNEGTITATSTVGYGEYEDYMLNITSSNIGGGATVSTPTVYSWSDGTSVVGTTNPLIVNPNVTSTYTVTATVNGCPITATTSVTVNSLPTAPTANNSTQCGTQIPTASVVDTNTFTTPTFKWYDAVTAGTVVQSSTSTTFTSSISATTTFYVAVVHPTTGCESPRAAVTVSVSTPDAITATVNDTTICLGDTITLTAANSGTAQSYAYSWLSSVNSGVATAQTGASITATPSAAGTYTYTATAVDGSCTTTATVTVIVSPLPVITTATASPNVACAGSTINLDATLITIQAGTSSIGLGASTSDVAGESFLAGYWGGTKTQYLITASELTALGYSAGNITSLGFEPTTSGQTYTGFQLWIDQTSSNASTATFLPAGSQVYLATATNEAFTPVANAINTLSFGTGAGSSSSFNWDGVSNLVVTFSWSSVPSATTAVGSTMKVDVPGFTCTTYKQSDSLTPAAMFASTTGATSTKRPKFILGGQIATNVTSSYDWTWKIGTTSVLNTAAGTTVVPTPVSPATSVVYTVTATSQATGCVSASQNVTVSTVVAPLYMFGVQPQASIICIGDSVTMYSNPTGGCIPYTYSWSDGTSVVGTAASLAVTPTSDKTYTLTITDNAGTQIIKTATVTVNNPQPTSVSGQTICANSSAFTLSATESIVGNVIKWYAAATGGSALATGATFTTPAISATTTYYVQENAVDPELSGNGLDTSTVPNSAFWTGERGLIFTATKAFTLVSAQYYSPTTSVNNTVIVRLLDHATGTVVTTKTLTIPQGATADWYTMNLGFDILPGTYRLLAGFSQSVNRSTTGFTYPYALGGSGSITSGYDSAVVATSYNYFHNITIQEFCSGIRVPVTATLNIPTPITLSAASATICSGQTTITPVTVATGGSSYDVFIWSPSLGAPASGATSWTFNPTSTTTYTLTASQSAGTCSTTATYTVNVNTIPTELYITPSSQCVNEIKSLVVTGGSVFGASGKVGTGTSTNTGSTPFKGYYGGSKTQALYTAAELTAMGIAAGQSINSIGWVALTGTPLALNDFSVNIGFVPETSLGSNFIAGATTVVVAPASYTPSTGTGNIDFAVSPVLSWDGSSSLLVETCFNNNNGGGISANSISVESSTVASGLNLYRSQDNTIDVCTNTSFITSTTTRPNLRVVTEEAALTTWTPTTNLYVNAAATTPYLGGNATTVYVKSATPVSTTYTVTSTSSAGCSNSTTVTVDVNALPTVVTVNPATTCASSPVDLTAATVTNGSSSGLTFTYWTDTNATNALANPTTITLSGTYYIKGTNTNGCSVVTPVTVTVNPLPVLTVVNPPAACSPATVDITSSSVITSATSGLTLSYWSDSAATTTALTTASAVTTTGTYYIKAVNANGCSIIMPVSVTVNVTNAPTASAQTFCTSGTVADLVATGSGLQWYATSTSSPALTASTALATGTYFVSQTVNGCESTRTSVSVTVNSAVTPTGATTQTINGGVAADVTIEDIIVTGTNVIWYPTSGDATAGTNAIAALTQLVDGTTYYAVSVVGTCRSSVLAVTVTVVLEKESFDIKSLKFYPNPVVDILTISYSNEITSVQVYDISGRQIRNMSPNSNLVTVDLSDLATSVYVVKVFANDASSEFKVVKK